MNIYDIAEQAGVSIATVSRVINNKGTVSPATRARVEAVLEKNNYTPSAIARGMVGKPMRKVAVLTVDIREDNYAQTAYTIEREFSSRGYEVILCNTGNDQAMTLSYLQAVTQKQVDGIILVGSIFNALGRVPEIEALLRSAPVVLANGKLDVPNSHSVQVDDVYGVRQVVEHLVSQGRRELVYLKDLETASADAKCSGFRLGMREHGLNPENRVLSAEFGLEGGKRAVEQLLASGIAFDGIVCGQDLTAVGAVKELQQAGLRVPEEVAVTGYNNSVYAKICQPELTSVNNEPERVGLLCVQLLEQLLAGETEQSPVVLRPELVVRGSA